MSHIAGVGSILSIQLIINRIPLVLQILNMKNINIIILALGVSLFCVSCRKDVLNEEEGKIIPIANEPETIVETNLTGHVTGRDRSPIAGVAVYVAGEMETSDDNGVFSFKNIDLSNSGTLVRLEKDGYFDGFQFASGMPGENSYLQTALVKKSPEKFQNQQGGMILLQEGSSITFQPNTLVSSTGNTHQGDVNVSAHWYDPSSSDLGSTMPGDLRGISEESENVQLITYGMMAVELENNAGEELQLAEGSTALLTFSIPDGSNAEDYTTIPTWHLDEITGEWIEEGEAIVDNGVITTEVSHFSFWNCDVPFPLVNITGLLKTNEGFPIVNQAISIKDNTNNQTSFSYTNDSGFFWGKVPAGVDLSLNMIQCNASVKIMDLGILDADQDLGEINANLVNDFQIKALLLDCSSLPVTNGYVTLETSSGTKIVSPDNNGMISYTHINCDQSDIIFTAYNLTNDKVSEPITIQPSNQTIDLMSVTICEDNNITGSLRFSVDFGTTYHTLTDVDVTFADNNILYLFGEITDDPSGEPIYVQIKYDVSQNVGHYVAEGLSNGSIPRSVEDQDLDVQISPFSDEGDLITATFSDGRFEGDFQLSLDKKVSSGIVTGQVWQDENSNGIRESNELPLSGKVINIVQTNPEQLTPTYYPTNVANKITSVSDADGNFIFDGVIVGEEYYLSYRSNSNEEVSPADQTGDTEDSDFTLSSGSSSNYITENFFVEENVEVQNIGLGILPAALSCDFQLMCCPTAGYTIYAIGGVGPFQVEVYDTNDNIIYDEQHLSSPMDVLLDPGSTYRFVIEDATNTNCENELFLETYLNSLRGIVWIDEASGTPNERDNTDLPYENLKIEMLNEAGVVVEETFSNDSGFYSFDNFEPGNYRIKVGLPAGYEYLELGSIVEDRHSHIEPTTGISLEKSIGGWDFDIVHTINVGLKEL